MAVLPDERAAPPIALPDCTLDVGRDVACIASTRAGHAGSGGLGELSFAPLGHERAQRPAEDLDDADTGGFMPQELSGFLQQVVDLLMDRHLECVALWSKRRDSCAWLGAVSGVGHVIRGGR